MVALHTLKGIASVLEAKILGEEDIRIERLATDSRTLLPSEGTLFVALVGERHNGHNYIEGLYRQGIRAFIVSEQPHPESFPGAGFILVEDSLLSLQLLAAERRKAFTGPIVAVAGSNGKTIVKEWIYQLLGDRLRVHRSPKSYNSQLGVALSLWMLEDEHQLGVIECGISMPGEMDRLEAMVAPDTGIFTKLGSAHQEHFGSMEQKLSEKLGLFRNSKKLIYRYTKGESGRLIRQGCEALEIPLVCWSLDGEGEYRYRVLRSEGEGLGMEAITPAGTLVFTLPFSDEASLENALHALTFALEEGLEPEGLLQNVARLEPVSMRLEILEGIRDCILVNDSYNADIGGLEAALDLLNRQDPSRKRLVVLSDLLQSGLEERKLYRELAALLKDKEVDHFVGIGPALLRQKDLFPEGSLFFPETEEFLPRMDPQLFSSAAVLLKGSRQSGFERITSELQQKSHQTRLETDLNAIAANFNLYRAQLGEGTGMMVMVKALSYGSGHLEIARVMQYQQADALAVAFADEGIELRKAGISLPILVLNPDQASFGAMVDFRLEPEIYNTAGLRALEGLLAYREIRHYPVHLKVDTGMHRLGFREEEIESLLPLLGASSLRVASVFTHLAASDEEEHDDFTREQLAVFDRVCARLEDVLSHPFLRHALNTSGIERFPEGHYDMVRLGIGLHGLGSLEGLVPASTFRTVVSQIKEVREGDSIGYSRAGTAGPACRVATLPVGYADGLDRRLGRGRGKVWIRGNNYPTVGNICMDMCMVDVSGSDVREGDTVEIFGKNLGVHQLASWAETIPYEILTSVSERVKRIYLQE